MKVVGFGLKKVYAEKKVEKILAKPSTSIEFTELEKEKVELFKDGEVIKLSFKYVIQYSDPEKKKNSEGEIAIEGEIVIAVTSEESKEIIKEWKKKKLPGAINLVLFNVILRRCTPKAIFLEDEVNLPFHTPMPKLQPKKEE